MTNIPWKGQCERCGEYLLMPFVCKYCGKTFCVDHYPPEDHNCPHYQKDVRVPVHTDFSRPSDQKEDQRSVEPVVESSKKKIIAGIVGVVIISLVILAIIQNPTTPEPNIEWEVELLTSELGYDAETAKFVAQEVNSWTDFWGGPFLGSLKEELGDAKGEYDDDKLAKVEITITKKLSKKIKKEIPDYKTNNWDLENVIRYKEANCLGYTQLFFISGEVIGLQVEPVEVVEFVETYTSGDFDFERFLESDDEVIESHAFCLVNLSNENVVFVELSASSPVFSKPLILEKKYVENGTYREAKHNGDRDIFGYVRIRLFGKKGLISSILTARAYDYYDMGKYEMAISNLNEAIEMDSNSSLAYNNRGCIYKTLGEYESAISNFSKAIEIDPKNAVGYYNRGHVYILLFDYQTAITDFTKAIESDQNLLKRITLEDSVMILWENMRKLLTTLIG